MIKLKNVSKFYWSKNVIASGIFKINLELNIGEFVAITGESGSGKSTLLNVISGLDSYEEGEMYINGEETSHYSEKDFEDYRRKYVVNIFQNFNLVNSYTVYENVELALLLNGEKRKDVKDKVIELIKKVDLYKYRNTKVSKLSGGQKQRVAIARALAKDTPIIIADEPTGNLDAKSAKSIIKLLSEISKDKLVVIVTHNYDQVSDYVTRKIKMYDGKILEDKKIKDYKSSSLKEHSYKNITFFNKLRLGLRNTFNIKTKFVLLLLVYLFIIISLLGEYSGFKKQEYESSISGYNSFFSDTSDNRIVIKKNNKEPFTDEDYEKISKLNNIKNIVKTDALLDKDIGLESDNIYIYGYGSNINLFTGKLDYGRMPEADNEVIIMSNSYDYYLNDLKDEVLESEFNIPGYNLDYKLKVVGIKYYEESIFSYNENKIYLSSKVISDIGSLINEKYSKITALFENKIDYYRIIATDKVPSGNIYISDNYTYLCPNNNCINRSFSIKASNLYYTDSLNLTVSKVYNKENFNSLVGLNYDEYNDCVFVNANDYKNLFNKGEYQSSVFVKDSKKIYETEKELNDLDINTLVIKDTLSNDSGAQIFRIFKLIVTIVLVIVLFFISYFVIKIILKSRNVYFSTIRMLGANLKVSYNLLLIELLTVTNIAYFSFVTFILLIKNNILKINYFSNMIEYLQFKDYILLYIILIGMSYLMSKRYSRKVFDKSAIKTLKEEV